MNGESVLVGHSTKLLVRPKLTLFNKPISITNLKKCVLNINFKDFDGKNINFQVKDPKFSDDEDYFYEFIVPTNIETINVSLEASIKNLTHNRFDNLKNHSQTFNIKNHRRDKGLYEMYLRKIGKDYYIYCLGKNGEPCGQ